MSQAIIKGGLTQDKWGNWVDAHGRPVDVSQLPAHVQVLIGYVPPKPKRRPKKAKNDDNLADV